MWKIIARLKGWHEARDDDGTLVVFHPDRSIHFSGPKAWRAAALEPSP